MVHLPQLSPQLFPTPQASSPQTPFNRSLLHSRDSLTSDPTISHHQHQTNLSNILVLKQLTLPREPHKRQTTIHATMKTITLKSYQSGELETWYPKSTCLLNSRVLKMGGRPHQHLYTGCALPEHRKQYGHPYT